MKWETSLANEIGTSAPSPPHQSPSSSNLFSIVGVPRIFDFDSTFESDGDKIGVTTTDGFLFVLSGATGAVVARHDLSSASGKSGSGAPLATGLLVTRVVTRPDDGPPDLISLSMDGHLHVLTTRSTTTERTSSEDNGQRVSTTRQRTRVTCHERVELGESSMTALLSADLDGTVAGHEILVATHDGLLMALTITPTSADGRQRPRRETDGAGADFHLGHNVNDPAFIGAERSRLAVEESAIPAWEAEVPGASRFAFSEPAPALVIKEWTRSRQHVIGEAFSVAFDVGEAATEGRDELLRIKVYEGVVNRSRSAERELGNSGGIWKSEELHEYE